MMAMTIAAACVAALGAAAIHAPEEPRRAEFVRGVANLEYSSYALDEAPSYQVSKKPDVQERLWYGTIIRRLQGDGPWQDSHYVPFAAAYAGGIARTAWCDVNFNGDLTDDPRPSLSAYPGVDGTRSFLVDLRWTARDGKREVPIDTKVRVVLEPGEAPGARFGPRYREQNVHAMLGAVTVGRRSHTAVLLDGNGDGLYTKEFGDGVLVDLDDDRHFDVDRMSPAFGPFGAPFVLAGRTFEVVSVDPEGRELSYREGGEVATQVPAAVGAIAPAFTYLDLDGRRVSLSDYRGRVVLLYFWASWCGGSREQAAGLREIYEQHRPEGLEILGVSYDTDRSEMEAFRARHGHAWPTSFSGHMLWEDPVGRLYQARKTGTIVLIDRDGVVEGLYGDVQQLRSRLAPLLRPATGP